MYELPTEIRIGEQYVPIRNKGDFRMVLECFSALNDIELDQDDRVLTALIIFYEGLTLDNCYDFFDSPNKILEAIKGMYNFFNCGEDTSSSAQRYKLIDWDKDSQLIVSAVNNVAKKEIRSEAYIHWWTFMGYYMSIGESALSNVVSIRNKIVKGKKLEDYEKEYVAQNPNYFDWDYRTLEDKQAEQEIREMWENG